ncbi:unnamed protein product [Calypogeia fissa]
MADPPTSPPPSDAAPAPPAEPSPAPAPTAEATPAPVAADGASPPIPAATGGVEGGAPVAVEGAAGAGAGAATGETGEPAKPKERKLSRRKTSLKKKEDGDEEEVEVPKIIYPIDSKIQETLRKAWTLFIKKGQKKKTEIAEMDIATVMRSIAINPTETQVKEVIANTKAQDVTTISKGFVTYECFEQRMAESFQLEPDKYLRNSKERILAALHTISGGVNEMSAADLKKIMMTKGEVMTEQEAALMVRNAGDRDTGKVYVEEYADVLSKDGIPQPPPDPTVW